jgi:hypothetical protein
MAAAVAEFAAYPSEMLSEARRIIASGARAGVQLRLVGGLAVLAASRDQVFAGRPYRDIDLVGLRRQAKKVVRTLTSLDYEENRHARFASAGQVMQFFRECSHVGTGGERAHVDDRIDVYLDVFRLDHEITLKDRLALTGDGETVPAADILLVKLQRAEPSREDLRDVVALLKDATLDGDDSPGTVNLGYLAALCGRDWRLHHDVTANLARSRAALGAFGLAQQEQARVAAALDTVEDAIAQRRKTMRWRLRALAGERLPWTDMVDERDGQRVGLLEDQRWEGDRAIGERRRENR